LVILGNIIGFILFNKNSLLQIRLDIYKQVPDSKKLFDKMVEQNKKNKNDKKEINSVNNPPKASNKNKKKKNKEKNRLNNFISNEKYNSEKFSKDDMTIMTNYKTKDTKSDLMEPEFKTIDLTKDNDDEIKFNEYNNIPYSQALRVDKRTFFRMLLNIFLMRTEIISLIFYPEEFTHKPLTLSIYILDFQFNYFLNALLYSDEVVSQKYHNNGDLEFKTSLALSFVSNIISSFAIYIIKRFTNYSHYLLILVKDIQREKSFLFMFKKIYKCIQIKEFIFFIFSFISSIIMTYYLFVFCKIYEKSQISLLKNYFLGIAESMIISGSITFLISFLRYISLKCKSKKIYRTSVYLNEKF
jgi:hypothetical protein